MSLEHIQDAIKQLTGAVNAQIEQIRKIEQRLLALEAGNQPRNQAQPSSSAPKSEQDLKDINRLPDIVKELPIFEGNPVQYISWVHSVEGILQDYEIVRNKPIYRAILKSIRQKIRGNADSALISYNIFDEDWGAIKQCLSLHYADKRDLRTLEHQLSILAQGNSSVDEFYANVNHQFSLIVNKIKTEDYNQETIAALIETYRNRALDVFIRGLNGELSKMLTIQRPQTLPEAYSSCLEIQNLSYRNLQIHTRNFNNSVTSPINKMSEIKREQIGMRRTVNQHKNIPVQQRNLSYNIQHNVSSRPPPRPSQPKPPVQMEVDPSVQTKQINYINRPSESNINAMKRGNNSDGNIRKQQRMYHIETQYDEPSYEDYTQYDDYKEDEEIIPEENPEINFMTQASLAYLT